MSGHSKWASIKHKKAITDAKRSQLFSKLSKNITLAARKGMDPKSNISLASGIEQAKAMNMPHDNIERAIKKVSDKSAAQLESVVYEAIGPGGVAMRITGVTDNKNRTVAEIKKILNAHNAKLVTPGSISWMFQTPATIDKTAQQQLDALIEALDNQDDIDNVATNLP